MKCDYIVIFFLVSLSAIFTNCRDARKSKSIITEHPVVSSKPNTDSYDETAFDTSNHACSPGSDLLKIGGYYKGHIDSTRLMDVYPSNITIVYCTKIRGISYAFSKKEEGNIFYISCNDQMFITDGIKIGDRYKDVKSHIADKIIYRCPGWGIYVSLRSGWHAYFGLPDEHSQKAEIADTARVICFFKNYL